MSKVKSIFHIITGLGGGGAEGTLYKLCIEDKENKHIVISLTSGGKYKNLLEINKIDVFSLDFKKYKLNIKDFKRILKLFEFYKPDIIQGWMYHGDFIASIVSILKGQKNLYWNIRHSSLEKKSILFYPTFFLMKICALISHILPKKIICCSINSVKLHQFHGYKRSKFFYLPNGVNTEKFKPNHNLKRKVRDDLSVKDNIFLFGMVARYHDQKDHKNLLKALNLLSLSNNNFKFLLIGKNLDTSNNEICDLIKKYNLIKNVILLGEREDINSLMCSIDCHVLSSAYGEAFPNVIAEAMASGIPCIATNVGDSKYIVGETGWIVNPRDPKELFQSMHKVMNLNKEEISRLGKSARKKVITEYSLNKMIYSYQNLYK